MARQAYRLRNPLEPLRGLSREQWAHTCLMFSFFFLVTSTFWVMKPLRTALLLSNVGSEHTPILKLLSIGVIAGVVFGYSHLVDRVRRIRLTTIMVNSFAILILGMWCVMAFCPARHTTSLPCAYGLYLLADLFSTVMVTVFWSYLNDSTSTEDANRLYGPIGLGGILGGVAGGVLADSLAGVLGQQGLLLLCVGTTLAIRPVVWLAEHGKLHSETACTAPAENGASHRPRKGDAFEGARLIRRSRYLMLIVVIIASYELVSTMNDFVLNEAFDRAYDDPTRITQMYGRLGWVINGSAFLVQLLLVPLFLPHKRVALLFTPMAMIAAATGFVALPGVLMCFPLLAADNGLNYSIQQSAKETLYVPLSRVEKYKAKAFIDMFVFRASKGLAAVLFLGFTALFANSLHMSMGVSLAVLLLWTVAAVHLARAYELQLDKPGADRAESALPVPGSPWSDFALRPIEERLALLKRLPTLDSVPEQVVEAIAAGAWLEEYPVDRTLYLAGEPRDRFLLLIEGEVGHTRNDNPCGVSRAGEALDPLTVLRGSPAESTATTTRASVFLCANGPVLQQLSDEHGGRSGGAAVMRRPASPTGLSGNEKGPKVPYD